MTILQATVDSASVGSAFMQYGILGILAFLLGYFAWQQYLRLVKKNEQLEEKIDKLQQQMMEILVEERDRLDTLIRDNTMALSELQKTIYKYMMNKKD
jgi:predicted PurR-regulated permease PerM